MHFDQDGTYNLVYIAEDECGNKTLAERVVEVFTVRTVLYPDGTLIINEKSSNQASNEALHGGTATNVYIPFDPNGATDADKYIFIRENGRPWHSQASSVKKVEVGDFIKVPSLAYWCSSMTNCTEIDLSNVDASDVKSLYYTFRKCEKLTTLTFPGTLPTQLGNTANTFEDCEELTSLDLSGFGVGDALSMGRMFKNCSALTSLTLPIIPNVTTLRQTFNGCSSLRTLDLTKIRSTSRCINMEGTFGAAAGMRELDVSHFDTSAVTTMQMMFHTSSVEVLDLSSFDTSSVTDMYWMFTGAYTNTIYVSNKFVTDQVTSSSGMFQNTNRLVGGAGTVWSSSNPTDKTYAHIDGGTSNPGYFTAKA